MLLIQGFGSFPVASIDSAVLFEVVLIDDIVSSIGGMKSSMVIFSSLTIESQLDLYSANSDSDFN